MRCRNLLPMALAAALCGCLVASDRLTMSVDLTDDMLVQNFNSVQKTLVDLTASTVYRDNKSRLESITDVAIVGEIANNGPAFVRAEFYIAPNDTTFATATQVRTYGVKLWGPFEVRPNATARIDWNHSSSLIKPSGREILVREAMGDGQFSIFAVADGLQANFTIRQAALVLVLETEH